MQKNQKYAIEEQNRNLQFITREWNKTSTGMFCLVRFLMIHIIYIFVTRSFH